MVPANKPVGTRSTASPFSFKKSGTEWNPYCPLAGSTSIAVLPFHKNPERPFDFTSDEEDIEQP